MNRRGSIEISAFRPRFFRILLRSFRFQTSILWFLLKGGLLVWTILREISWGPGLRLPISNGFPIFEPFIFQDCWFWLCKYRSDRDPDGLPISAFWFALPCTPTQNTNSPPYPTAFPDFSKSLRVGLLLGCGWSGPFPTTQINIFG